MINLIPVVYSGMADIVVLVLLPIVGILFAIPSKRRYAGVGLIWGSYMFATFIWVSSFITVYHFWRRKVLVASLLFLGIGHVFLSPVIYIENGRWSDLACLLVLVPLMFLFYATGRYLRNCEPGLAVRGPVAPLAGARDISG